MENLNDKTQQQDLANEFWQAHFPEYIGKHIDEQYALNINLWDNLQLALNETDNLDVIWSIVVTKPAIDVATANMYMRIIKTAKQTWHTKRLHNKN